MATIEERNLRYRLDRVLCHIVNNLRNAATDATMKLQEVTKLKEHESYTTTYSSDEQNEIEDLLSTIKGIISKLNTLPELRP